MLENSKDLSGIKGWLLFYVCISTFEFLVNLFGLFNEFYIFKIINSLKWNAEKIYDVGSYILLEFLIIVSLVYLLTKNKKAPLVAILTEITALLIGIIDFFLSNRRIDELLELMLALLLGTIWIFYFRYSKRVKSIYLT